MDKQIWKTKKEKKLDPDIVKYVSGEDLEFDKQLIPYDIKVNKAHAKMLAKVGLISQDDCNNILKALDEIPDDFELKKELEDVHLNIEAALGKNGEKINTGRSRSSQAKTDMNLYLKDLLAGLEEKIKKLQTLLKNLAVKYKDYEMPAYTHMQPAQRTTFGYWLEKISLLWREGIGLIFMN